MDRFTLLRDDKQIVFQRYLIEVLMMERDLDIYNCIMGAIFLQKIYYGSVRKGEYNENGDCRIKISYNDFYKYIPISLYIFKKFINIFRKKQIILITKINKMENAKNAEYWVLINNKKLEKIIKRYEKIKAEPTYKGLNKYSWDKFLRKMRSKKQNGKI